MDPLSSFTRSSSRLRCETINLENNESVGLRQRSPLSNDCSTPQFLLQEHQSNYKISPINQYRDNNQPLQRSQSPTKQSREVLPYKIFFFLLLALNILIIFWLQSIGLSWRKTFSSELQQIEDVQKQISFEHEKMMLGKQGLVIADQALLQAAGNCNCTDQLQQQLPSVTADCPVCTECPACVVDKECPAEKICDVCQQCQQCQACPTCPTPVTVPPQIITQQQVTGPLTFSNIRVSIITGHVTKHRLHIFPREYQLLAPDMKVHAYLDQPPQEPIKYRDDKQYFVDHLPLPFPTFTSSIFDHPYYISKQIENNHHMRMPWNIVDSVKNKTFFNDDVKWLIMIDDDSLLFPHTLISVLSQYDWRKPMIMGQVSEYMRSAQMFGDIPFGGGGVS